MAVYCNVCASRLGSAVENDGSFSVAPSFKNYEGKAKIEDTCEDCGEILREAVARAANEIAVRHQEAILDLRLRHEAEKKAAFEKGS